MLKMNKGIINVLLRFNSPLLFILVLNFQFKQVTWLTRFSSAFLIKVFIGNYLSASIWQITLHCKSQRTKLIIVQIDHFNERI